MTTAVLRRIDDATVALVRLAAAVAGGDEQTVRTHLAEAADRVPHVWVDELILQSHLFSGFPRALNAARDWRTLSPAPAALDETDDPVARDAWRARGEAVCAQVYGERYDRLRVSVRALHPALDDAMIVEGYGRIIGRPALDLPRRELCIVAACAITGQDRQLRTHLHGALNVGVAREVLGAAIDAIADLLGPDRADEVMRLRERVEAK